MIKSDIRNRLQTMSNPILPLRGKSGIAASVLLTGCLYGVLLLAGCKSDGGSDDKQDEADNSSQSGSQSTCNDCLQTKCDGYELCSELAGCTDFVDCLADCANGNCVADKACVAGLAQDVDYMEALTEVVACTYTVCADDCEADAFSLSVNSPYGDNPLETDSESDEPCAGGMKTRCTMGLLQEYNDCGYVGSYESCGADMVCEEGECVPCEPHAQLVCVFDTVWWQNSCGIEEEKVETCADTQYCDDGACIDCEPHQRKVCYGDDRSIYWEDGCGNIRELESTCGENQGCNNGECDDCEPMSHIACDNRDIRWFDSCGRPGEVVETCGDSLFCVDNKCETYPNSCTCDCTCTGVAETVIHFTCEARSCDTTCEENCAWSCDNNFQTTMESANGECQ